ncbi:MAG: DUF5716 family protein [Lachnospiraceae bacterium]|nr:DUF5716 family protein [Lachnospiraceae bacterium]
MSLMQQIPKDFYRVFRTKNMEHYFEILVELYNANMEGYNAFGITKSECRDIINETMVRLHIVWQEDEDEQETDSLGGQLELRTPAAKSLNNLINWGWLREDYDERINEEVLSFPEYSLMFVELFWQLRLDSDSQERESIMSIYSLLYTYYKDKDNNNDILKNAWKTSRRLTQLLTNMQEGMRAYFDKLSNQRNFLGIQEVLIQELNNSDSKKYAMLTTTDSFYRYKEQVKELISDILEENETKAMELNQAWMLAEPGSKQALHVEHLKTMNDESSDYMVRIEREFDSIERKYNTLIEQKAVFAQRALARVHFILQEGMEDSENVATLIRMISQRIDREHILEELRDTFAFTKPFQQFTEKSMYQKRDAAKRVFTPHAVEEHTVEPEEINEFVPKPLYSGAEIEAFRKKNTIGGRFVVSQDSVSDVKDLEKLMILWQQVTNDTEEEDVETVSLGEKITTEKGYSFTKLTIKTDKEDRQDA